ncbi:Rpn family recombination-promoting nuclease/putative transposase [uncultured Microscilla sp.]|uniref:Rpn family recombination-promoting nuclease/putative transposase n=1 Tax=uncultured Microscilla sp. TaxID=432653 RepID=UPI0026154D22|nr:Rpn family recombination-promoting nuclease/putative transposase [uncultured Microscilla sp.]
MEKFINPFTDFGFKKLFGEERNKDLLIDFINELLHESIHVLTYLTNERLAQDSVAAANTLVVYCENEQDEKFIVQLQKVQQGSRIDRSIYYTTFPVQEQAEPGKKWNFELKGVYTIALLGFVFAENVSTFHHKVQLVDLETNEVFNNKLQLTYLEIPKFSKQEHELETHYDKWMYIFQNLGKLQERPAALQEKVFQKLLDAAEIAHFDKEQQIAYQDSLKNYRGWDNVINTSLQKGIEQGRKEGIEQGLHQTALRMKEKGFSPQDISDATGLTLDQIEHI